MEKNGWVELVMTQIRALNCAYIQGSPLYQKVQKGLSKLSIDELCGLYTMLTTIRRCTCPE